MYSKGNGKGTVLNQTAMPFGLMRLMVFVLFPSFLDLTSVLALHIETWLYSQLQITTCHGKRTKITVVPACSRDQTLWLSEMMAMDFVSKPYQGRFKIVSTSHQNHTKTIAESYQNHKHLREIDQEWSQLVRKLENGAPFPKHIKTISKSHPKHSETISKP